MTKEEIIDVANDMAFMACIWIDDEGNEINDLVKFAQLIAAKEREACAKVCGEYNFGQAPKMIQDAIRARGETTSRGEA